jgi:hypothetical protein
MPASLFLKEIIKAFFIVLLINLVNAPVEAITRIFLKEMSTGAWDFLHYTPSNPLSLSSFLLLSITVAPVAEELFFRGFLYNSLKSRLPISVAAIAQAVVFALIHPYAMSGKLTVFLTGIALVIVYEKRKTLLAPIFVHCVHNALPAIAFTALFIYNHHVPATNWEEAMKEPEWVTIEPTEEIVPQEDGTKQWQYAVDKWGTKGKHLWKKEINAFNAVCFWYPDDKQACAKAKLSIVFIYTYYLRDYRRAVVNADRLMTQYPEQKEQYAKALSCKGLAYLMLKDFKRSRDAYSRVINEFTDYREAYEPSRKGIILLDKVEPK